MEINLKTVLIIIGLLIAFLAFTAWQILSQERRNRARRLERINREWGKMPERVYSETQMDSLYPAYVKKMNSGLKVRNRFFIDDITWNDLEMDQIFMHLNNTQSSAGDEAVYQALREPCFSGEELDRREQLITYFSTHPKEREKMQMELAKLGRMKNYSMSDYIDIFMDLHAESNLPHYVTLIFMLIAIAIIPFSLGGVLGLVLIAMYNIVTYYKQKAKMEPYFVCISYVVTLVKQSRALCKAFQGTQELKDYLGELDRASASLNNITGKAAMINNGGAVSDNPAFLLLEYLRISTHIDLIQFNRILNQVQTSTTQIQTMMDTIGRLELAIAVASFREMLPMTHCPQFAENEAAGTDKSGAGNENKAPILEIKDLYHPLIAEPVANTILTKRPVLLTGSNASGKSTFLKTVAINVILAQSINTVAASSYRANFFRVFSSMALRDNLGGEESYYMVEIRSLKRIVEAAGEQENPYPVICFIDEVLRGTNTVERIAASSQIMKTLAECGCMSFAATHDVELTYLLERYYDNYHFREDIEGNDIHFSYCLHEGRSETRNAIKLLEMMGYDTAITQKAEATAKHFLNDGKWEMA